jgi:glycosyltransferase involved in cell wall biosynthesis
MANDAPIRVLHLASWFPSAVHRTLGNFVQRHVQAIATVAPSELLYAAPVPRGSAVRPGVEVVRRSGVLEKTVYFQARKPVVRGVTRALLEAAEAMEVAPDVVHLHVGYPAGAAARELARKWNVPLVMTEHWTAYQKGPGKRLGFWQRRALKKTGTAAAMVCPVSDDLGTAMQTFGIRGPERFRTVPNVVDTRLFHPLPASDVQQDRFTLLHVSSLVDRQKNISGMLRALQRCLPDLPQLEVVILGDGDPAPHEELALKLGIAGPVTFGGELPLGAVARRMREADALLLFSHFENFPCVIGEAWASGIPVISSDVGGIREHLGPELGILVPPGDEAALADAIAFTVSSKWNREVLRSTAEGLFSIPVVAEAYLEVYRTAIGRQSSGTA